MDGNAISPGYCTGIVFAQCYFLMDCSQPVRSSCLL